MSTSTMDPRTFVTSLISSIQAADQASPETTQAANPLLHASDETQKALLTLHVLFPNELLPALDLLDRGLVTRLYIKSNVDKIDQPQDRDPANYENSVPEQRSQTAQTRHRPPLAIYLVQSSHLSSRGRPTTHYSSTSSSATSYEVRLEAWSCSCPAFTFAAFPAVTGPVEGRVAEATTHDELQIPIDQTQQLGWTFGGRTLGADMPVCKHLLACVLVEHSAVFAGMAEDRETSVEELAGWAAGWGD